MHCYPGEGVAAVFIFYKIKALMWSDLINELSYNESRPVVENSFGGMVQNCVLRYHKSVPQQLIGAIISLTELCGMITLSWYAALVLH